MRIRSSSQLLLQSKRSGYILMELVLSLVITCTIVAGFSQAFVQFSNTWKRLSTKANVYDAGHYMLDILDKNISYDISVVTITKDVNNVDKLVCDTTSGNQTYTFTHEDYHIYKTIRNNQTTPGKNPLYVSSCKVINWEVNRINDYQILVEITLQMDTVEGKVCRLLSCHNGKVVEDVS